MKRYIFNICLLLLFMFVGLTAFNNVYAEEQDVEVFCVEYNGDSCGKLIWDTSAGASTSSRGLEVGNTKQFELINNADVYNLKDLLHTDKTRNIYEFDKSELSIRTVNVSFAGLDEEQKQNEFKKLMFKIPTKNTYSNPSVKIRDELSDVNWLDNLGYQEVWYEMDWLTGEESENAKADIHVKNEFNEYYTDIIKNYIYNGQISDNDM